MDFVTKKFDPYKQERKKKRKNNNLTEIVSRLAQKVGDLSEAREKQEQYSRHNCLLLRGIPEK